MNHDPQDSALPRWSRRDIGVIGLLFAGAVFLTGSLWLGGPWFISHEMLHQLVRLFEFDRAVRGGQFPVRWCDDLMAGYGYPFFNFYGPLCFAAAEVFHLIGLTLAIAWKAEITGVCWLGGVGMYGLARRRAGQLGGAVAAMLYLFAPYHAMTLYVRGNLPELTALCIWPWAFWGAEAAVRSGKRWQGPALPAGALAIGALAATHVLTMYQAAFNLVAWGLFLMYESRSARPTAPAAYEAETTTRTTSFWKPFTTPALVLAGLGLFGAAVGAFFWIPALHDIRFCPTSVLYQRTAYRDHFVYPLQLLLPSWGYGLSVPGPNDGISFQLGIALWIGVLAAARAAFGTAKGMRRLIVFVLGMVAVHLFAMMSMSAALWKLVPGAPYLQFPWRLLIPATFWASLAGGLATSRWASRADFSRFGERLIVIILLALPVALTAPYVHPLLFQEQLPQYHAAILRRIFTDTAEGEYLPVTVETVPKVPSSWRIAWVTARGQSHPVDTASGYHRFQMDVKQPGLVAAELFWFPGWHARVDGANVETLPITRYGFIGWDMPAGKHEVEIVFGETPLRQSADLISLTALVLAVVWLVAAVVRRGRKPKASVDQPS